MSRKYSVLDLFAGAGGLSLGFIRTGKFEVKVAVENNPWAQQTYLKNHNETKMYGNILDLKVDELKQEFGSFDVIIGGPPCQGFSNANRQHNKLINMNNALIKTYVQFIETLKPKAFLLENVKMLGSDTHRFFVTNDDDQEDLEYLSIQSEKIQIYEGTYSFPFHEYISEEKQIVIPTNICSIESVLTLRKIHRVGIRDKYKEQIEGILNEIQTYIDDLPSTSIAMFLENLVKKIKEEPSDESLNDLLLVVEGIIKLEDIRENSVKIFGFEAEDHSCFISVQSFTVIDFIKGKLNKDYWCNPSILNAAEYGVPQLRERYIMTGIRKDLSDEMIPMPRPISTIGSFHTVYDAIADLEKYKISYEAECEPLFTKEEYKGKLNNLRDNNVISNHTTTNSTAIALERFSLIKQGENFHSLESRYTSNYADPSRTQNSIYMRPDYYKPCGTVTNVRKAMWIHPVLDRAISIREAARLQSFPDSFTFVGTKDRQYQQVGNAVPPMLAEALANQIAITLSDVKK
jgi:DNA (cytosine-5)-methyltransferase 1